MKCHFSKFANFPICILLFQTCFFFQSLFYIASNISVSKELASSPYYFPDLTTVLVVNLNTMAMGYSSTPILVESS